MISCRSRSADALVPQSESSGSTSGPGIVARSISFSASSIPIASTIAAQAAFR